MIADLLMLAMLQKTGAVLLSYLSELLAHRSYVMNSYEILYETEAINFYF
jgi:hypothetical protein